MYKGVACYCLLCLSLIVFITLVIHYIAVDKLRNYILEFTLAFSVLRIGTFPIFNFLCNDISNIYKNMPEFRQRSSVNTLASGTWMLIFIPLNVYLVHKIFIITHKEYFLHYGEVTLLVVLWFNLDQLFDWATRSNHKWDTLIHHGSEIFITFIFYQTRFREQGVLIITLISAFHRFLWFPLFITHFHKCKKDTDLTKIDIFLTQIIDETILSHMYKFILYFIHFGTFIPVLTLIIIYMNLNWNAIHIFWKIIMIISIPFFILVDIPLAKLLYKRSLGNVNFSFHKTIFNLASASFYEP